MSYSPLPPFFRSFGIKDLGGGSRQVFGFKGLAGKVFKNQCLKLSRSAENGFGAVSRAVWVGGRISKLPQSDLYRYRCARWGLSQWISIRVIVMKQLARSQRRCQIRFLRLTRRERELLAPSGLRAKSPALRFAIGRATRPHFVPIKKSSLTKARPGEGVLFLRHGFLGYDGDGHTSTLQQVNCHPRRRAVGRL
jgi:hypothetical protein